MSEMHELFNSVSLFVLSTVSGLGFYGLQLKLRDKCIVCYQSLW